MANDVLVAAALVAVPLALVALAAWRRPLLLKLALRNPLRRRSQTALAVGGLMVGTAIIAGSFVAGDSFAAGIRESAYDALGPAEIFLQVEGRLHYPALLYDELAADPPEGVIALAPLLLEEAAAHNPRTSLSEPRVAIVGLDTEPIRAFGGLWSAEGGTLEGRELGDGEAYLLDTLARDLEARAGDTIELSYAPATTPRIPRVTELEGTLQAAVEPCPTLPIACPPGPTRASFTLDVEPGAVGITTILVWYGPTANATDLDQTLRSPDGQTFVNTNGTPAAPDNPSHLHASAPIPPGPWTIEIGAKAAAAQPFRVIALVFHEEHDLAALRESAKSGREAGIAWERPQAPLATRAVTVRGIVSSEGFGDFLGGANLFLPRAAVAQMYGVEGRLNTIVAATSLDPTEGPARARPALLALQDAVNASAARHPDLPALAHVEAVHVKGSWVEGAEEAGRFFTVFLNAIGSFTVLAGVALIVSIFVLLAEERKRELGILRALGLRRRQLVLAFVMEGTLYALAAGAAGVGAGMLLSLVLVRSMNDLFQASGEGALDIPFRVEPESIAWSFAAGFLVTLAAVVFASSRVSSLQVVQALRQADDAPRRATRRSLVVGLLLFALGLAGTLQGFLGDDVVSQALAPEIAILGLAMAASRFAPRAWTYPLGGLGAAGYAAWSLLGLEPPEGGASEILGPVRGVLIVIGLTLALVHLQAPLRGLAAVLARFRPLARASKPGLAYPLAKKARTGLTVVMFALVVLVVVAFSALGETFRSDLAQQSGGYEIQGDATVPLADLRAWHAAQPADPDAGDPLEAIERHDTLRYAMAIGGDLVRIEGHEVAYRGPPIDRIYTFDEGFATSNRFPVQSLDPAYATPEEAYRAVLADPALVIAGATYNVDARGQQGVYRAPANLSLDTPSGRQTFRVIAFHQPTYVGGIFVHPSVLESSFSQIRGAYLFDLEPGADAEATARAIERAFQPAGMDAETFLEIARSLDEQNRQFLAMFQLFLSFGLLTGVASLGIIAARNVLERRQEIGTLRACGYSRADVRRVFLLESLVTTTLGVLIGAAVGLYAAWAVVATTPDAEVLGIVFRVPWWDLAQIGALVYAATLASTWLPARQAAAIPPAEAVRIAE